MASRNIQLIRARRRYLDAQAESGQQYQAKLSSFQAMIGRGDGTIYTNRAGWIYVTDLNGVVHEAINVKVPNTWGRMVWVGNDAYNPHVKQVLSLFHAYNTQPAIELPSHTHRWDHGPYTDFFEGDQFLPGLIVPVPNTMTVKLYPFPVKLTTGGYMLVPDKDTLTLESDGTYIIDLEPYRPDDGALFITIAAAQDGTITIAEGAVKESPEVLLFSDIPDPVNEDDKELWAARLFSGQVVFTHRALNRNLIDLRWGRVGGGPWVWGDGTGSIDDQADLIARLAAKMNVIDAIGESIDFAGQALITAGWDNSAPGKPSLVIEVYDQSSADVATNGDFEDGDLTGWTTQGSPSAQMTEKHAGTYAALLATSTPGSAISQTITSFFDKHPAMTFWHKGGLVTAVIYLLDASDIGLASKAIKFPAVADWTLRSISYYNAFPDATKALFIITADDGSADVYIDDVVMRKLDDLTTAYIGGGRWKFYGSEIRLSEQGRVTINPGGEPIRPVFQRTLESNLILRDEEILVTDYIKPGDYSIIPQGNATIRMI